MLQQIGKDKKTIKPWVIYLWRNGDKMEGASPVATRDGIKEVYRFGWEIEPVSDAKRNEDKHQAWRAKTNVKNILNNTLNVLNWYGKKVLDNNGNVDKNKFDYWETETAMEAIKTNYKLEKTNAKLPKDKKLPLLDMDNFKKIKQFPIKEITIQEAKEYGLSGTTFDKFINQ